MPGKTTDAPLADKLPATSPLAEALKAKHSKLSRLQRASRKASSKSEEVLLSIGDEKLRASLISLLAKIGG